MRPARGFTRTALVASVGLAALSLLLPYAPVFDPWAWLIWGRELGGGELDTSGGASWKPLPSLLAVPLAALGDEAPELWLLIARSGWIMALALVGRLAWRLAGAAGCERRSALTAGLIAALGLLLLRDAFTPWLRQFAGGLAEPLLVAVVVGAIEAHLQERGRVALALLLGASLIRPEAFPLLAAYGVWLHRRQLLGALPVTLALLAVPALWLLPDLIGSGSPLTGIERSRADDEGPLTNGLEALWRSANLAPAALLAAAVVWVAGWAARPPRLAVGLALGAAGWVAIVVAMALVGFPGLPRFAAPAGAVVCALGAGALAALWRRGGAATLTAGALAVLLAGQGTVRAAELPDELATASELSESIDDLRELTAALGPEAIAACAPLSSSDLLTQSALAWELERGVAGVELSRRSVPTAGLALVGPDADPSAVPTGVEPVGRRGGWRAYRISCAATEAPAATDPAAEP